MNNAFTFSDRLTVQGTMGFGCWSWGSKDAWGWTDEMESDAKAAFEACLESGITFFDTAEVYGEGVSETLLAKFIKDSDNGEKAVIATKFMPYFTYLRASALKTRFDLSKARLGNPKPIHMYQVHGMLASVRRVETWAAEMVKLVQNGDILTVGVSNFTAGQVVRAHAVFEEAGMASALVSNQIEYSLLRRTPEQNGVIDTCKRLGIKIIAYSPLGMGRLTGKYGSHNPPPDRKFGNVALDVLDTLVAALKEVSEEIPDSTVAQVAINWVICKGAFPIVGARNAAQARENAHAMTFRLTDAQVEKLDKASANIVLDSSLLVRFWQD